MLIAKWGNSLAVRLPGAVVEALELREGDDISIHVVNPGQRVDAAKPVPDFRIRSNPGYRHVHIEREPHPYPTRMA